MENSEKNLQKQRAAGVIDNYGDYKEVMQGDMLCYTHKIVEGKVVKYCSPNDILLLKDNHLNNNYFTRFWRYIELLLIIICLALMCFIVANVAIQVLNDTAMGNEETQKPVISCYYNIPSAKNSWYQRPLQPQDIHPHLCTHINIAFARVVKNQVYLDNAQYKTITEVVKLKSLNPDLKILLSIGGAGGDDGFSKMVVNHASRKTFIKSIKSILRNYSIDGVDLDWEFPAVHALNSHLGGRERQHFSQLLMEIRAEYVREKRNYLLTVAVAAPEPIVNAAYDVDQLNMYTDFVNIMTYDFHYFSKFTPFTGFNSPLYPRPEEQLYIATLNINYTVHLYMNKGLDKSKIVIGVPTYGHTYNLVNADNVGVGAPASGVGNLGSNGFVNYPDVCKFKIQYNTEVTLVRDLAAKVPYLYKDHEWVSFDDPYSVTEKAHYIKKTKLRGAMIYSLNADDYEGVCEGNLGNGLQFPLSLSIRNILN